MHQLSYDEEESFPIGAKIVRRDFYVDDLISGGDSVEEVREIRRQVKELLSRGHFPIRKLCSNESAALEGESECDKEQLIKFNDGSDVAKALGLVWDPSSDQLLFNFSQLPTNQRPTKRVALSTIAKFYDPLGLITPIITKSKIFLQSLWIGMTYSYWDDLQLSVVQNLKFPRFVLQPKASVELHGFCDASMSAYGACLYLRSETNGESKVHLLCAKSRVAPLKALTIPRLELSAALLLAELIVNAKEAIDFDCTFHCWPDSSIVLAWIRQAPREINVFVSNRIAKFQEMTKDMTWHHVPTNLNPADVVSRGCTPRKLLEHSLWANGPPFLLQSSSNWPSLLDSVKDLPERRSVALIGSVCIDRGSQALLAALRQRYWPIGGRKFVASVINKCVRCFRMKPVTWEHVMDSLPANRVQPNAAFHTTGVDYCGPFYNKAEPRNKAPNKCYIAVLVCFSTKAAHLEDSSALEAVRVPFGATMLQTLSVQRASLPS